ncbi:MAG: L-serine ammonia-lyase, iron-sulfur-dependent, subunit alpha [Bacteroidales bacterium]|jgi:L-serine dehydratase|nr:L-serine ammonia-lyase, iron-sulfur-dependent, subunit alpha [Bacteroidales bacterium]
MVKEIVTVVIGYDDETGGGNEFMKGKMKPSIFNDVLGPVMRGPSSSHTAASWRIGRIAVQILGEELSHALIEFDKRGAWASNYEEQGTVIGMNGGLLGLEITDEMMLGSSAIAEKRGVKIEYAVSSFQTDHPNTVRLTLKGVTGKSLKLIAVSTGGGMFEIRRLNNFLTRLYGDDYELIVFFQNELPDVSREMIEKVCPANCFPEWSRDTGKTMLIIRSSKEIPDILLDTIRNEGYNPQAVKVSPVMPIIRGNEKDYPFDSLSGMLSYNESRNLSLGELGIIYEYCRSGLEEETLIEKMKDLVDVMEKSITEGLKGTVYKDRILHHQSHLIAKAAFEGRILSDDLTNNIIANVTALMESKSSMGVIVAAPTAGACGTLGGAIKAMADCRNVDHEKKIKAYFAAGLIGIFIADGPGFSAEAFGCQVETGAASAMTAAALVEISDGSAKQAVDAASMAYQNMIGLICDPIADRVEAPCLGKNVSAAMNALSSSTMAVAGFDALIPLDQVIRTVHDVGQRMPCELKCTGLGGLSVTPGALEIKKQLSEMKSDRDEH